jgi:type II secretory pathway component PulK
MMQHFDRNLAEKAKTKTRSTSRGFILIAVLVCLAVTAMLIAVVTKSLFRENDQIRTDRFRLQAGWLAESALERSFVRLSVDGKYKGEVWKVPADELDGRHAGLVTIAVEEVASEQGKRRVRAEVRFPQTGDWAVRLRREWTVAAPAGLKS